MSRLFVAASSQYLSAPTPAVTAYPFTISVWVKPASATGGMAVGVYDTGGNSDSWLIGGGGGAPPFLVARSTANGYHQLDHTTNLVAGTWVNLIGVFNSSTDRRLYVNADAGVQQTTTCGVPSSLDATAIGRNHRLSAGGYFDGRIAQAAMWTSALGSSDRALLAAGNNPNTVASGSRVAWWPLSNNVSPETDDQGSIDLTVTGATYSSDEPPAAAVISGTSSATGSATGTLDWGLAPTGAPTSTIACDRHARTSGSVTSNGSDVYTTIKVFRATSSGGTYTEVTSNCVIAGAGASWTWQDKRPAYGTPEIALGATAYYKIKGRGGGTDSAFSSVQSITSNIDIEAIERAAWAQIRTEMADNAFRESVPGLWFAYGAGRYLITAAYMAAKYPDLRTDALAELNVWSPQVATQLNSDNMLISPQYPTFWAPLIHFAVVHGYCASMAILRTNLAGNATADALYTSMAAIANAMGKAPFDEVTEISHTRQAHSSTDATSATASAWAASTSYSALQIVRPTTPNGKVYRCIRGGTSGSSEPTWPTATDATVIDGSGSSSTGLCWQECTNDSPDWQASTVYVAGQLVRPTTKNNRSYRCLVGGTSGGSQPTWPTSNYGTVTDGTVTWRETTLVCDYWPNTTDTTAPYAQQSDNQIADASATIAAALTQLMAEPGCTDFYTGGAYRAQANATAIDHIRVGEGYQANNGGLHQSDNLPQADTNYGSYTVQLSSVALKLMGSSWEAGLAGWTDRALDWFDTYYATEPAISSATPRGVVNFVGMSEMVWRRVGYQVRLRTNPLNLLQFTSAYDGDLIYNQAGVATNSDTTYGSYGNTLVSAIGLAFAYGIQTLLAGSAIGVGSASGTLTSTPRISGTASANALATGTLTIRVGITGNATAIGAVSGTFRTSTSPGSTAIRPFFAPLDVAPVSAPLTVAPVFAPLDMEVETV